METVDPFDGLDFDLEEVKKIKEEQDERRWIKDPRVCSCGHGIVRHKFVESRNAWVCEPARMSCPCKQKEPVLEVQDTRDFLSKTKGHGARHALALGIAISQNKGHWIRWTVDKLCFICKDPDERPTLVALKKVGDNMVETFEEPGPYNALICQRCRQNLKNPANLGYEGLRSVD